MRRRNTTYAIVASLCAAQVLFALVVAPWGCDAGLLAYIGVGALVMIVVAVMPHFQRRAFSRSSRTPAAMGFAMFSVVSWLFGLFVGFAGRGCGMI